eukprot:4908190-Prymnesium_polylepis.1
MPPKSCGRRRAKVRAHGFRACLKVGAERGASLGPRARLHAEEREDEHEQQDEDHEVGHLRQRAHKGAENH